MFASKCQGDCHAVKVALCDLGDSGWGIPSFRIELCCFPHPLIGPLCFFVGLVVFYFHGSPLALIDLFHPETGTCHVTASWCVLFLFVCFCFCGFVFCCVLCWFWFCFLFLGVLLGFLDERDRA